MVDQMVQKIEWFRNVRPDADTSAGHILLKEIVWKPFVVFFLFTFFNRDNASLLSYHCRT